MTDNQAETGSVPPHLHDAVDKAEKLMEQGLWSHAQEILVHVTDQLDGLGIESSYVQWLAAVVSDSIGLLSQAVEHIVRARRMDPLFPRAITSERIILTRVAALIDVAGPEDAHVLAVVSVVRQFYPAGHAALRSIEDALARKSDVMTEPPSKRAQA